MIYQQSHRIAFFDFDGTVTTKDTFLELIKFQKGKLQFYAGMLINGPFLIAYKLKIISNQTAKEMVLRFFFKGDTVLQFQKKCDDFALSALPQLIRAKALKEIKQLQEKEFEVAIVSASAGSWISKWSDNNGLRLIATVLHEKDGQVTGRIEGKNCHGEEKVRRIRAAYDLSKYDEIYCYGDTAGDRPMLSLGTKTFYKPFR